MEAIYEVQRSCLIVLGSADLALFCLGVVIALINRRRTTVEIDEKVS